MQSSETKMLPIERANLGCPFDTVLKGEPQPRSCFHQIVLRSSPWVIFLIANSCSGPSSLWVLPSLAGGPELYKKDR